MIAETSNRPRARAEAGWRDGLFEIVNLDARMLVKELAALSMPAPYLQSGRD